MKKSVAELKALNRTSILKIGIVLVLLYTLVLICVSLVTRQTKKRFQLCLTEVLREASRELELGQSQVVTVENPFKADVCLTCPGYADEDYIYSQSKKFGISKRVAGRVAKKIPPYDRDYLVLLKKGKVVCVVYLQGYASSYILLLDRNTAGEPIFVGESIFVMDIDGQIEITVKKLEEGNSLLITRME